MKIKATLEEGSEVTVELSQEQIDKILADQTAKPKRRWRAKEGETCFCIKGPYVEELVEAFDSHDDFIYNTGNYFKTPAEADAHKEYLLAVQKIKDSGDEVDWSKGVDKWYILYDYHKAGWAKTAMGFSQSLIFCYYATLERAEEVLKDPELMEAYKLVMNIRD